MGLLTRRAPRARELDEGVPLALPEPEPGLPRRPKDPAFVGDYRVLRLLGEGGMGIVYLGESVDGRRVAVKVIQSEYARDPEFRERFRAETAHARQVEEAYTAAVLDADPDAALPYLVTEFVPGPTLRAAVNAGGPLGTGDLARLAVGMAAALTAIHGAGIAHHDLKPGNVLLGPSGPRVIDFGIANGFGGQAAGQQHGRSGRGRGRGRRGQAAPEAGQIGTPGYMAPEQARGEEVGPAADVFAWAAVMTFAASGAPPFGDGTPEQLLHRVTHDVPDLGALPPDLAPLVRAAFSKEPGERPSAGDLLLTLMGEKSAGRLSSRAPERRLALPPGPVRPAAEPPAAAEPSAPPARISWEPPAAIAPPAPRPVPAPPVPLAAVPAPPAAPLVEAVVPTPADVPPAEAVSASADVLPVEAVPAFPDVPQVEAVPPSESVPAFEAVSAFAAAPAAEAGLPVEVRPSVEPESSVAPEPMVEAASAFAGVPATGAGPEFVADVAPEAQARSVPGPAAPSADEAVATPDVPFPLMLPVASRETVDPAAVETEQAGLDPGVLTNLAPEGALEGVDAGPAPAVIDVPLAGELVAELPAEPLTGASAQASGVDSWDDWVPVLGSIGEALGTVSPLEPSDLGASDTEPADPQRADAQPADLGPLDREPVDLAPEAQVVDPLFAPLTDLDPADDGAGSVFADVVGAFPAVAAGVGSKDDPDVDPASGPSVESVPGVGVGRGVEASAVAPLRDVDIAFEDLLDDDQIGADVAEITVAEVAAAEVTVAKLADVGAPPAVEAPVPAAVGSELVLSTGPRPISVPAESDVPADQTAAPVLTGPISIRAITGPAGPKSADQPSDDHPSDIHLSIGYPSDDDPGDDNPDPSEVTYGDATVASLAAAATPSRDEAASPGPGTELVLAPWPDPAAALAELLPPGVLAARAADNEIDVDGVIDVGPDWIQETGGRSEPALPPIRFAELHALWDGEVDLEPAVSAPVARTTGTEVALVGSEQPPTPPARPSTELEPFQPVGQRLPELAAPAIASATPTEAPPTEPVELPPASDHPGLSVDSAPTMQLLLPGQPGARARAAAVRRGARRRRNVTILVAAVVALIATLVPILLSSSGGASTATVVGLTPSASVPAPTPAASLPAVATTGSPAASASPTDAATTPPVPPGNQPGVPGLFLQSVPGGVTVTIIAPFNGGPVTSYQVTSTPGGTRTLSKPGIFQVPVDGCGQMTASVRASGPGGLSEPSAAAQALGCVPPGPPTGILAIPDGHGHLIVNWAVPANVGGNAVNLTYVVTVFRTSPSGVTSDTYTISGHSYTRTAPTAADPYFRVTVAAKNAAGVGESVVAWGQ
ncbi:protein kinase [Frankia sp. AgB1.8]|uniref:protein kinase domain-containing protein n=1 Tax=Frankia sp. AgB1.8 TaxID=2792839 RepID=UPI0019316D65|nr:protein kinase [Frankia sp. AgB1.8]MBL7624559.1 protein kinase [Frankia sp. AgB1.8]